jgi:(p)ppGpp synthase/HD superfamily hydrolase
VPASLFAATDLLCEDTPGTADQSRTEICMTSFAETLPDAVAFAAEAHASQTRKRADGDPRPRAPYVSHLLGVAGIVIEDLGTPAEAVAALLHDTIEDCIADRPAIRDEIGERFGAEVLEIVEACTGPKKEEPGMAEFRVRKQVYLDQLAAERNVGAIRVSLADKVHNARCTVNDLELDGPAMWDRFNAGADDQLWWYGALAGAYTAHAAAGRADQARAAELTRLVARMRERTREASAR